jgi:hypothetical protein
MINLAIHTQPDDESCGPTCLQGVYNYYGMDIDLQTVINSIERSASGGTLSPLLGKHALSKGFSSTIYVNNLDVFDPTWFQHSEAAPEFLIQKLRDQMSYKKDEGIAQYSLAYQQFLEMGGNVRFRTVNATMLKEYFARKIPILTGLSATYLYRSAREIYTPDGKAHFDDIRGTPCGHFVILCGYDESKRHLVVADPHRENPISHNNYYKVSISRLINAIMLGVLTYDGNLLIIEPKEK